MKLYLVIHFQANFIIFLYFLPERLFITVGVHTTRCNEFETYSEGPEAYMSALKDVLRDGIPDGKVVAVGECGLDYDRLQFCEAGIQRRWFEAQFELAQTFNLPMFLHLRGAATDFLEIVRRHSDDFPAGVVHSFDGSKEELDEILKIEKLHIGLNGCSLKTEDNLEIAAAVPIDRLQIETDAPWCDIRNTHAGAHAIKTKFPSKDKKKHDVECLVKGRNEPCNIRQVFEVVAEVHGKKEPAAVETLAAQILKNSETMFFGKG